LQGKLGFFPVTSTIFVRFTQNFSTSIRYYLVMVVFSWNWFQHLLCCWF